MKKILIILPVLLILIGTGCNLKMKNIFDNKDNNTEITKVESREYKNYKYGFKLIVPENFDLVENGSDWASMNLNNFIINIHGNVNLTKKLVNGECTVMEVDGLNSKIIKQIKTKGEKIITLCEENASEIGDYHPVHFTAIISVSENQYLYIVGTGEVKNKEKNLKTFEEVVSSFTNIEKNINY